MLRLVLMPEIVVERLVLPEYTISPEDLSVAKLPVPPVREANLSVPENIGFDKAAFESRELCRLDILAMVRALFGTDTVPIAVRLSH